MDELIVLLIKGIIRMIAGPQPVNRRQFNATPAGRAVPRGQPAVRPAARPRAGRRSSVTAAIASPILTGSGSENTPGPTPPARPKVATATATKPPTAATVTVRKWLTPKALRQQVIVSEILRPPLALRGNE
jgi:hypothetical protein